MKNLIDELHSAYLSNNFKRAEHLANEIIKYEPNVAIAWKILGAILASKGKNDQALKVMQRVVELSMDDAEAYSNLGVILKKLGRLEEAESNYRIALRLTPDVAELHLNLGNLLREFGRTETAAEHFKEAIRLKPNDPNIHNNLANTLRELGRLTEAESSYRKAIWLKPDSAETYANLVTTLKDLGEINAVEETLTTAIKLMPSALELHYERELLLPDLFLDTESIFSWRRRFQAGIERLLSLRHLLVQPLQKPSPGTFNLAYHNLCNLDLMKSRSQLARQKSKDLSYVATHVRNYRRSTRNRIKIGFCSKFFFNHTIGKLFRGIIEKLNPSIFEVILIHIPNNRLKDQKSFSEQVMRRPIFLSGTLEHQHSCLAQEKLDILFYPDIGMSAESYYLAHARLAPVQIVGWGHPDSSGIDTIDYFLSSVLIEPEAAEENYSERLIQLDRLPSFYYSPSRPIEIINKSYFGLPESARLYGCPQSLFKLHPDFDEVLAEIAVRDSNSRIVMIEGPSSAWRDILQVRWSKSYSILNQRVIFVPRQPINRFLSLINHFDVLLDPIHFGSGNTMYESFSTGTPTVTFPGRFMRGRIVAGAYTQLELREPPVVSRLSDYAMKAVEIAMNDDLKIKLRLEISSRASCFLYTDNVVLQQIENFFVASVLAAEKNELLPKNWCLKN